MLPTNGRQLRYLIFHLSNWFLESMTYSKGKLIG